MNIRKIITASMALALAVSLHAQGLAIEQVRQDKRLATGNYLDCYYKDFPTPSKAPAGFKVVYLSTYTRHGARLFSKDVVYDTAHKIFTEAKAAGNLTPMGLEFEAMYEEFYPLVQGRAYDLTPVGQEQHRRHARRIFKEYRPLFKGNAHVDARSTQLTRTILSMAACTETLKGLNPKLFITTSSSPVDMGALNPTSKYNPKAEKRDWSASLEQADAPYQKELRQLWEENCRPEEFFSKFFKDWTVVRKYYQDEYEAQKSFFYVLSDSQCACGDDRFLRFATAEEMYAMWEADNYRFCAIAGMTRHFSGRPWALAEALLRDIVDYADSDLAGQDRPGPYPSPAAVRMRYGHDYKVSELLSLLDVEGFNKTAMTPREAKDCYGFQNLTMGCTIEMPFYRNSKGEILVKMMLDGRELQFPIQAYSGNYYRWSDFRAYCMERIEAANKLLQTT